jgi:hypothetical protein
MHDYDINLFLSGVLLGASLAPGGIGLIGFLLSLLNFLVYLRCVQRPLIVNFHYDFHRNSPKENT